MKIFEEKLGLTSVSETNEVKEKQELVVLEEVEEQSIEEKDFHLARNNIINVIQKANEAMSKTLAIANDKEDARSFEALDKLMNTIVSSNMDLVDLHKKKPPSGSEIVTPNGKIVNNTQNNIVFNGTPKQLKDFISKMKSENEVPKIEEE